MTKIIEKPEDVIKYPYILELLGLPEKHQYSESKLEQEIQKEAAYLKLTMSKKQN
ncbi:MAG: hypothetical protein ABII90_07990 [Bacteroidota bacterium]